MLTCMHPSQDTNSRPRRVHCADWIAPKTRESNKNQREREREAKTRITALSGSISYSSECWKRSALFSPEAAGAGFTPKATGVERAGGGANRPDLAANPAAWAPLSIYLWSSCLSFYFLFVCLHSFIHGRCLICTQTHVHTHTKEAICCTINQRSNNSGCSFLPLWPSLSDFLEIIHIKWIDGKKKKKERAAMWITPLLWVWLLGLWVTLTFRHSGGFT